jgi:hypothetical protein
MAKPDLTARFAIYEPGGNDPKAYITNARWRVHWVANKPGDGMLDIELDKNAPGAEWLLKPCDIGFETNTGPGNTFEEPRNSRFVHVAEAYDLTAKYGSSIRASCPPVAWLLTKALVHAVPSLPPNTRPYRRVRNWTVGHLWNVLAKETQALGFCSTLDLITSTTWWHDAKGLDWPPDDVSVSLNVGDNFLDGVLYRLIGNGWCDAWFEGNKLRLFRPGGVNYVKDAVLLFGRDLGSSPREVDRSSRANRGYVMGDSAVYKRVNHPTAAGETPWGDWEVAIQVAGVPSKDLAAHGRAQLANQYPGENKIGTVCELVCNPEGVLPFRDYQVWDQIEMRVKDGPAERYRVSDLTLTRDSGRITGSVTLGHRRLTPEIKATKVLKTLSVTSGQGAVAGSGSEVKAPTATSQIWNLVAEGADPDGVETADETFAAVLAQITDNVLEFGPNLHVIEVERGSVLTLAATQEINVPVTVRGGGTIVLPPTGPAFRIATNEASGSVFEDVTFLNNNSTAGLATALELAGLGPAFRLRDITIQDCYFDRCGIDGNPFGGPPISLRYTLDAVVRHCTFRYPTPAGIVLWSDNENAVIEDCTFIEPWANISGYDACVHVYQDTNIATIRGNRHINRGEVTGKSHVSQRGLYIGTTGVNSINAPDNRWEGTGTEYSGGGLVRHTVFQPWDVYLEWLDRSSAPAAPTSQRTIMYAQGGTFRVRNPTSDVAFLTKPMVKPIEANASDDLTLTGTHVEVPGTLLNFTTAYPNASLQITGVFDMDFDNTSGQASQNLVGVVDLDGIEKGRKAVVSALANIRVTASQSWSIDIPSAGSHTVRLRAYTSTSAGTARCLGAQSGWSGVLVDGPA